MIVVHDIFVCKPGNASKLAKLFKEWAEILPKKNGSVMTDLTGQFHRVIMATSYESLTEYDEEMKNMGKNMSDAEKAMMDKFKDMNDMYVSGSREMYKVW